MSDIIDPNAAAAPEEPKLYSEKEKWFLLGQAKRQSARNWGYVIIALVLLLGLAIAWNMRTRQLLDQATARYVGAPLDCSGLTRSCPVCEALDPTATFVVDTAEEITAGGAKLVNIEKAIDKIVGKNIAIVVDDSGSMNNKREEAAQLFKQIAASHAKKITHVYLYADGYVEKYLPGKEKYLHAGAIENTCGALKMAAQDPAVQGIVLITDEPGDDWALCGDMKRLPPVIANCVIDVDEQDRPIVSNVCTETLRTLAARTGGTYIEHHTKIPDAYNTYQQSMNWSGWSNTQAPRASTLTPKVTKKKGVTTYQYTIP